MVVGEACGMPFTNVKFDEKPSLYFKSAEIKKKRKGIYLTWEKSESVNHYILYRATPSRFKWLNSLYFKLFPRFSTSDSTHAYRVCRYAFDLFLEKIGLAGEISFHGVSNEDEAVTLVLFNIYFFYFKKSVSFDEFVEMFELSRTISGEILNAVKAMVDTNAND